MASIGQGFDDTVKVGQGKSLQDAFDNAVDQLPPKASDRRMISPSSPSKKPVG